jgi:sugar diacid utilization regulator
MASGTDSATGASDLAALAAAVEGGAGLPALARAAAEGLGGSVAVIDRAGAVLAVADASAGQERELLSGGERVETMELRVGDAVVGELRVRPRGGAADPAAAALVSAVVALAVERARSPDWASDRLAGDYVRAVLDREVTDRGDIVARGAELGIELESGAGVVALRAQPLNPQEGEWRERVLNLTLRALRGVSAGSLAGLRDDQHAHSHAGEVAYGAALVPGDADAVLGRAADAVARELSSSLAGFVVTVGRSRHTADPADLYRAGKEALLAMNVGAAEGSPLLAFEDTGSYRLLLPAMSEDPGELERFYAETVAPLAAYDEQYETELVNTVETYLDEDGSVTPTAARLFTHRHTVRYRLERVKEVTGLDLTSTEGREKVGLGLKAMRVLGIAPPRGPANEPGTKAGKVSRGKQSP